MKLGRVYFITEKLFLKIKYFFCNSYKTKKCFQPTVCDELESDVTDTRDLLYILKAKAVSQEGFRVA